MLSYRNIYWGAALSLAAMVGLTTIATSAQAGGVVIDGRTGRELKSIASSTTLRTHAGSAPYGDEVDDGDDRQRDTGNDRENEQLLYLWASTVFNGHYMHDQDGQPQPVPFMSASRAVELIESDVAANGCSATPGIDLSLGLGVLLGLAWRRRRRS